LHRSQVDRLLTRDDFGCTLDRDIAEERMHDLFDYYGCTPASVAYIASVGFSINVREWVDSIDRTIVFLAKFANLPPAWVEEQDIVRQNRLVKITFDYINTQKATIETDNPPEWT
jgi:hypothetical protein